MGYDEGGRLPACETCRSVKVTRQCVRCGEWLCDECGDETDGGVECGRCGGGESDGDSRERAAQRRDQDSRDS